MPKKENPLLPILKTALKIESDGATFYSMASKNSSNDSVKQIFDMLAGEEQNHYNFFLDYFRTLEKGVKYDLETNVRNLLARYSEAQKELFGADFTERLKADNHALSAVSIGIKLEDGSINFYKNQLKKAKTASEKKFYKFLIDAEIGHHDFLSKLEKEMFEDSWLNNRFSPF
jgi:rubrerythrin